MTLPLSAITVLTLSFILGLFVQDASDPRMMLPFMMLTGWLAITGRLLRLPMRDPVLLGLVSLWLLWLLSVISSDFPFNSKVTSIIMSTLPVSYMVWRTVGFTPSWQARILPLLCLAGIAAGIGALLQVTVMPDPMWYPRAVYPFLDPNMLGIFLSMILLPIAAILAAHPPSMRVRAFLIATVVITASGLLATQSRSAILSTAVGLGLIALMMHHQRLWTKRTLLFFSCAGVVVTGALVWAGALTRFSYLFQPHGDANVAGRLSLWQTAFEMSMVNPLTGYGFGTFNIYYPLFRQPGGDNSAGWWVHMDPLQWAVECGWLAPVVFYLICIYIARSVWKQMRDGTLTAAKVGVVAALLSLFINAHTAYPLHVIPFMIMATGMIVFLLPVPAYESNTKRGNAIFSISLLATLLCLFGAGLRSGMTLYLWRDVTVASASGDNARYRLALKNCIDNADPEFSFCKFMLIESLLNADTDQSLILPSLIENSRRFNPQLAQPDYYTGLYDRKYQPTRPDLAIESFQQSLIKNPTFWPARKSLIESLMAEERYGEAIVQLDKATGYPLPKHEIAWIEYTKKAITARMDQKP